MKAIVAGSRAFNDSAKLFSELNKLVKEYNIDTIISGGARGADSLGEWYACEHNLKLKVFPAKWDIYGKAAGYKRNIEMASNADMLIAFWDGESKGTKHMIEIAKAKGLKVFVITV